MKGFCWGLVAVVFCCWYLDTWCRRARDLQPWTRRCGPEEPSTAPWEYRPWIGKTFVVLCKMPNWCATLTFTPKILINTVWKKSRTYSIWKMEMQPIPFGKWKCNLFHLENGNARVSGVHFVPLGATKIPNVQWTSIMAGRRSAGWARGLVTPQRRGTQVDNWGAAAAVLWRWRLGAWRQSSVLWRSIWEEVDKEYSIPKQSHTTATHCS